MTHPPETPRDDGERRAREAERVMRERKDDLPSQRGTESPEGGRPPEGDPMGPMGPMPDAPAVPGRDEEAGA